MVFGRRAINSRAGFLWRPPIFVKACRLLSWKTGVRITNRELILRTHPTQLQKNILTMLWCVFSGDFGPRLSFVLFTIA